MKKYLFALFFFQITPLLADTTSTGTVYFTLPSTNTIDKNKSWATKNNDNWQAAATGMTRLGNIFNTPNVWTASQVYIGANAVLDINTSGTLAGLRIRGTGSTARIDIGYGATATDFLRIRSETGANYIGPTADETLLFMQNNTEVMRLTSGQLGSPFGHNVAITGRLGLATLTPSSMLDMFGGSITLRGTLTDIAIGGVSVLTQMSTTSARLSGGALSVFDEGSTIGNATSINFVGAGVTAAQTAATTVTVTIAGGGGAAATGNSTYTKTMAYGGAIFYSTNTICPFPKACFWTGASTLNVVDIQAAITFGSTVAMTSFQIVESSGGVPNVPYQFSPAISRFPRIDVTTATSAGVTSISVITTTGVTIPANTWVGVHATTAPVSGILPQGFEIQLNVWKKPYGGT